MLLNDRSPTNQKDRLSYLLNDQPGFLQRKQQRPCKTCFLAFSRAHFDFPLLLRPVTQASHAGQLFCRTRSRTRKGERRGREGEGGDEVGGGECIPFSS